MSHETPDPNASEDDAATNQRSHANRYEWESTVPALAIVDAVATATGRAPTDLPPLQHTVDPDAVDALLTADSSSVEMCFTYAGTEVLARGEGVVEVRPE
jgi:hypothetical protein